MRLTVELINNSLSYLNPLKERELDLRAAKGRETGKRIPQIENLGGAKDHDAIDLTDNDITFLANFPLFPRLTTLLVAQNRIAALHPFLGKQLPNLTTLAMTGNRINELADLDPLGGFVHLTHLTLIGNPVTKKEHYRSWVIWRCPSIRFLDFQKVKDVERVEAKKLFGTSEKPTELAMNISGIKSSVFDLNAAADAAAAAASSTQNGDKLSRVKLTESEKERVRQLLRDAKTIAEIERLEKMVVEGKVSGTSIE